VNLTATIPNWRGLTEAIKARVEAAVEATAFAAEAEIKTSMPTQGAGRSYSIGNVTRNLRQSERAGVGVMRQFGKVVMTTASGLRVQQNAAGSRFNVVVGARLHRASAPGEPPAIDTGALVNSVNAKRIGSMRWGIYESMIGGYLEHGTSTILPRPHVAPAAERVRQSFVDAIREAVRP